MRTLDRADRKQQIFELYANEVYLGNRGSFGIRGFSQASVAYFGKDLRQLSLSECAYLAGIIRAPNYYSSADRHPERGLQARDRVLTQMLDNKYINEPDVQEAKKAPSVDGFEVFVKGGGRTFVRFAAPPRNVQLGMRVTF